MVNLESSRPRSVVLVVDGERADGDWLPGALADLSYSVTIVSEATPEAIRVAVERGRVECVLLDGPKAFGEATGWGEPSWMRARGKAVPVVMFAGNPGNLRAAVAGAVATRHGPLNGLRGVPVPS